MLPLRYARLWRRLSIALLVFVLFAALAPAVWFDTRVEAMSWLEHADKWAHGLTFAALSVWFAGLFERRSWGLIAAGLMLFGLLIEGCQLLVSYRMADWLDVGANTTGIIVGLVLAVAGLGRWGLRVEDWYAKRERA